MNVNIRISKLIEDKGIKLSEIARRSGISKQNLIRILDTDDIKLSQVERISNALGGSIYELLGPPPELVELQTKVKKLEFAMKTMLLEKWSKEGKANPPNDVYDFPEFKAYEAMFNIFIDPDVKKAFDEVMEKRIRPIEEAIQKRKGGR